MKKLTLADAKKIIILIDATCETISELTGLKVSLNHAVAFNPEKIKLLIEVMPTTDKVKEPEFNLN